MRTHPLARTALLSPRDVTTWLHSALDTLDATDVAPLPMTYLSESLRFLIAN